MESRITWYHGTSSFMADKILKEGFKANPYPGIWGCAVYLTSRVSEAKTYGNTILTAEGTNEDVLHLNYKKDIPSIFPGLSYDEEEACRGLQEYTQEKGFKACALTYANGDIHLIVYDTSFFTFIDLDEDATESIA